MVKSQAGFFAAAFIIGGLLMMVGFISFMNSTDFYTGPTEKPESNTIGQLTGGLLLGIGALVIACGFLTLAICSRIADLIRAQTSTWQQ